MSTIAIPAETPTFSTDPLSEGAPVTMTDPVTTGNDTTAVFATVEQMLIRGWGREYTPENFAPWAPLFRRFCDETDGGDYDYTLRMTQTQNVTVPAFARWLLAQGITEPTVVTAGNDTTTRTPEEDSVPVTPEPVVLPIDHNHPGWFEFDKKMAEIAESRGMCGQYEVVGRQMGLSPRRHNHEVTVTLTLNVVTERGHRPTRSDIAAAITSYVEGRGLLNATTVSRAVTVEPTTTN